MKWLFFTYSLPTEPSRARVYVWRQVKKLGAINYQSVWIVPYSVERINEFKNLIEEATPTVRLSSCASLRLFVTGQV